ncbi:MAG: cyclic pyranopterin monophosphate synthase MoaC [Spirochaetaceae bacterium]|nr:cyclic pyranopterin monophosphate synthase MoaC [Spirochaetaceae bacterium]
MASSIGDFSHIDEEGNARMVNVSGKSRVRRTAMAKGRILLTESTIRAIQENAIAKGNVLATARVAGIMAAKRCSDLIPLCHNIEIEHVEVEFEVRLDEIGIRARAVCTDKTGIEMEALTAVSVAALTVYDMCKAVDKTMRITDICLAEKTKEEIG